MGFEASSSSFGGATRWRMQVINENRALWLSTKNANGVLFTGSMRTSYQVNCADAGSGVRFTWHRDPEPDRQVPFLPRDGWLETSLLPP
jgi:hypothetical protein